MTSSNSHLSMVALSLRRLPPNQYSPNLGVQLPLTSELTINERQKNDPPFSSMLDCVKRGYPTEETLHVLKKRVIQVSVSDKFSELLESGKAPVYLFPKRKACNKPNSEILHRKCMKFIALMRLMKLLAIRR